jgi:hypothetical protein
MEFCFTSQLACLDLSRELALLLFDNSIGVPVWQYTSCLFVVRYNTLPLSPLSSAVTKFLACNLFVFCSYEKHGRGWCGKLTFAAHTSLRDGRYALNRITELAPRIQSALQRPDSSNALFS